MNQYGFELNAEDTEKYEANKATVDAELARLVTEEQQRQLEAGNTPHITPEQHRSFFDQALSNLSGTGKTSVVKDVESTNTVKAKK